MRRAIKILFWFFLTLFLLGVAATMVLRILYPPPKLRALIQDAIHTQLHRDAQIGPVQLSILGISLERLRLSNVPDFNAGTLLYVESAQIHWALASLLHRTFEISEIALQSPQINLIRLADGKTLNISDLEAGSAPDKNKKIEAGHAPAGIPQGEPPGASASGWSWQIDRIRLKNGMIHLKDLSPVHMTSTLSGIELFLDNLNPTHAQGQLTLAELQNPVYTAHDFHTEWALRDIDPTLGHMNGWIHLRQGTGLIQNLTDLVATSKSAKVIFMPIVMLQNLDKLGFLRIGLPDFTHMPITGITGNYQFENGTMKIQTFTITSPQLSVDSKGYVQLASGELAVDVALHAPQRTLMGELDLKIHIGGTLSNPQTNLDSLKKKAFKATIKGLLDKPETRKDLEKTFKQIFH